MSPNDLASPKHRFPLWEIILVVLVVLMVVIFFIFRSGNGEMETTYEPISEEAQVGVSLNEPVTDLLNLEERTQTLEKLNEPVADPLNSTERAAALEALNN